MDLDGDGPATGGTGGASDLGDDVIRTILSDPPPPLAHDVTFEVVPGGYEIWYSERLERGHSELVDQSADFLEERLGVVNLGQIDHKVLLADGLLTDEVRDGLTRWWRERISDLDLG